MDNCFDKDLVIRLRKSDVKSFDIIYLKYHRGLYLNILKLIKDTESAKDILQEVFIILWEKRLSLDENKPVANWLFTVSYNKSVNYLKTSLRESLRANMLRVDAELPHELETGLAEIRWSMLEGAVKHLSPQKSKVFVLCKLQGKTYDETAKELKISRHTVKEYLSEAVFNVKDYIKHHPETATVFFCSFLTLLLF